LQAKQGDGVLRCRVRFFVSVVGPGGVPFAGDAAVGLREGRWRFCTFALPGGRGLRGGGEVCSPKTGDGAGPAELEVQARGDDEEQREGEVERQRGRWIVRRLVGNVIASGYPAGDRPVAAASRLSLPGRAALACSQLTLWSVFGSCPLPNFMASPL
jgi:hypothetical protein